MRKRVLLLSAILLASMVFPVAALAYGYCGGGNARACYELCPLEDCSEAYEHRHGCRWYSGQAMGDDLEGQERPSICRGYSDRAPGCMGGSRQP